MGSTGHNLKCCCCEMHHGKSHRYGIIFTHFALFFFVQVDFVPDRVAVYIGNHFDWLYIQIKYLICNSVALLWFTRYGLIVIDYNLPTVPVDQKQSKCVCVWF